MRKTERLKVIVSETNLKKTFPKKDLNPKISSKWPLTKFKFSQNDTTWCAIYEWRNWNNPNSKHILPQVGKVKVYLRWKIIVYIFTSAVVYQIRIIKLVLNQSALELKYIMVLLTRGQKCIVSEKFLFFSNIFNFVYSVKASLGQNFLEKVYSLLYSSQKKNKDLKEKR